MNTSDIAALRAVLAELDRLSDRLSEENPKVGRVLLEAKNAVLYAETLLVGATVVKEGR